MQSYWKMRKFTRFIQIGGIQIVNDFLLKPLTFNIRLFANENSKVERTEEIRYRFSRGTGDF